jgi:hypothetical protein
MCKFASFVLTKDREFWLDGNDSHSAIIGKHNLNEWGTRGPYVIKVEISPTAKIKTWPSLKQWAFRIDQDRLPDWHDAATTEKRTREALARRYKAGFKHVYASGCTSLTSLKADAAKCVNVHGCPALTSLKADAAETVYAYDCTSLTSLKADAAKTVYASDCPALTSLKADAAEHVYASGCTALTAGKSRLTKWGKL